VNVAKVLDHNNDRVREHFRYEQAQSAERAARDFCPVAYREARPEHESTVRWLFLGAPGMNVGWFRDSRPVSSRGAGRVRLVRG